MPRGIMMNKLSRSMNAGRVRASGAANMSPELATAHCKGASAIDARHRRLALSGVPATP
ncbi:hypothetical protein B0G84_4603 [Paraburkholderia sp. BL8N3]|nr:hypothetical protein B0G84_4603 [Paraburkholderia sp. BL8N3]